MVGRSTRGRTARQSLVLGAALVGLGCTTPNDADNGTPTTAQTDTGSGQGTLTAGSGSGAPGDGSTSGGSSPETDTQGAVSTDSSTGAGESTTTGPIEPPPPLLCSLEAVDPKADPATAVDAGDGAGQVPTLVGEVLVRNCGCHYTDTVTPPHVGYLSGKVPLRTHADFHAPFMGTFPQNFEGMPVYLAVYERVVNQLPLPMPSLMCGVEGQSGVITTADRTALGDWLAADAPDGANYP